MTENGFRGAENAREDDGEKRLFLCHFGEQGERGVFRLRLGDARRPGSS